jgi:hypothetical protein
MFHTGLHVLCAEEYWKANGFVMFTLHEYYYGHQTEKNCTGPDMKHARSR